MLCEKCKCSIDEQPRPLGRLGGKPSYFDWSILKTLTPGTDESVLVPIGAYATLASAQESGKRHAKEFGITVRSTRKSNGVRFWRLA